MHVLHYVPLLPVFARPVPVRLVQNYEGLNGLAVAAAAAFPRQLDR